MQENVYDNTEFFKKYSEMPRSRQGLKGAGEWSSLEKILPDFKGKKVLDLGCGYGWHCMYAIRHGAAGVLGLDLSEKMLETARQKNNSELIEYRRMGVEDFDYPPESFDIVLSSLTLHYIESLPPLFKQIYRTLSKKGTFIFSIEHPIFTAYGDQDWHYDPEGNIQHWPVDRYFKEGRREASFLGEKVIKYHHSLTSIIQGLLNTGFTLQNLTEPQPSPEMLAKIPGMSDELRRPMMLIISVRK